MSKIGIVTVLYKSEKVLEDFFYSLSIQDFNDFVLILVDNDSNEKGLSQLASLKNKYIKLNTIYIDSKGNVGVAAGNNIGIKKALELGCSHVLLSNNDLFFDDTTVISHIYQTAIQENKKMITPKILYFDSNKIWMAGGYFNKVRSLGIHYGENKSKDDPRFKISKQITYAPTCFMLIESKVFEDVGFMDEKYFVYLDDTDFVYRCINKNIELWYEDKTLIYHKVSTSTGGDQSPFYIYYSNRNKIYFVKKHYNLIYKLIAFIHISATRSISFLKYTSAQREALKKGIKDGLKLS